VNPLAYYKEFNKVRKEARREPVSGRRPERTGDERHGEKEGERENV